MIFNYDISVWILMFRYRKKTHLSMRTICTLQWRIQSSLCLFGRIEHEIAGLRLCISVLVRIRESFGDLLIQFSKPVQLRTYIYGKLKLFYVHWKHDTFLNLFFRIMLKEEISSLYNINASISSTSLHFVTSSLHWIAAVIIVALQSSSLLFNYNAATLWIRIRIRIHTI